MGEREISMNKEKRDELNHVLKEHEKWLRDDIVHNKRQQERIEANRLIDALEQEIDQLTGNSRLQRREVPERVGI